MCNYDKTWRDLRRGKGGQGIKDVVQVPTRKMGLVRFFMDKSKEYLLGHGSCISRYRVRIYDICHSFCFWEIFSKLISDSGMPGDINDTQRRFKSWQLNYR